jgi:predicted transcriptional regulator
MIYRIYTENKRSPRTPKENHHSFERQRIVEYPEIVYIVNNENKRSPMSTSVPIAFRVSPQKYALLEKLAAAYDRPKSWILDRALDAYLDHEAAFVAAVEAGMQDADTGNVVPETRVRDWLESWGSEDEIDAPLQ